MEKTAFIITVVLLLIVTFNGLNIAVSKRKIRREAEKNGWKIIKIRLDFKQSFLESFGPLKNLAFDVIYEDEKNEIMNPNIYVRFWGLEMDIEQNYPVARNQKMNT